MVIRLMTDDVDVIKTSGYLKDQIHSFVRELCVITSEKLVMVEPLIIRINNRMNYGSEGLLSDLKLFAEILRNSILPNVDADGNKFRFDVTKSESVKELTLKVSLI